MWPFINLINLNRYLIVWKINHSLVRLPVCLPVELSFVLGSIIAERLPTQEVTPWRKALAKWAGYIDGQLPPTPQRGAELPDMAWPIEAVLFVYPGKQTYGEGELIVWELKLIGNSADHARFLEIILPAMEDAGASRDERWHRPNGLWGRFDVHAIYAARGARWEPLAQNGKLDLSYRALPTQWAEGLALGPVPDHTFDRLTWLTPFDIPVRPSPSAEAAQSRRRKKASPQANTPALPDLMEALTARLSRFLPGKRHAPADVWDVLGAEDQAALKAAIAQAAEFPLRGHQIERAPRHWPGRWTGTQKFVFIPDPLVPYLALASILHVGRQTHFGCGTFVIT